MDEIDQKDLSLHLACGPPLNASLPHPLLGEEGGIALIKTLTVVF